MTPRGVILVTGGTGSLGTHILETAHREGWDAQFIVYSRDEAKQAALRERFPDASFVLGDIRDRDALARAMHGVDTVIHTAAYKRVPEAERQTAACVSVNVEGSVKVASAAMAAGVSRVVGISTDKACTPINAYGQSKALMERLFQSFARTSNDTSFHLVRYGNVLASNGSVVPLFRRQAESGGPITLTNPDMTRFWLTLDDAVTLVQLAMEQESGEVLVPACLSASMGDLAAAVAPGVEQVTIGSRGGERVHEKLVAVEEGPYARPVPVGWALRSLALPVRDVMPEGWVLSSDGAERLTSGDLQRILAQMDAGEVVETL